MIKFIQRLILLTALIPLTWTNANAQTALDFDGSDDYLRASHITALNTTSGLTVEAWIFINAYPSTYPSVVSKGSAGSAWELDVKNDGSLEWEFFAGGSVQAINSGAGTLSIGQWHHIAATQNNAGLSRIYIDGVQAGSLSAPSGLGTNGADLEIGSRSSGGAPFQGVIDDVRIWNLVRSSAEIAANMNNCLTGSEIGLVALYDMEDGTGQIIASDLTANNNDVTLTNMDQSTDWVTGFACAVPCVILDRTVTIVDATACDSIATTVNVASSQTGVDYQLRNDAGDVLINNFKPGTGGTLGFPTGMISSTTTFNVLATKKQRGLDFDGINDEVSITDSPSLNPSSAITVEAWIYVRSYPTAYSTVVAKFTSSTAWELDAKNDGTLEWELKTIGNLTVAANGGSIPLNQWTHVAGTYNGSSITAYINGVQVATTAVTGTMQTNFNPMEIGARASGLGGYFDGKIDEVRVWNISRTSTQITDNMNACLTGSETGLVAFYNLEDGPGSTTANDLTSNNNNGTLSNMDPASDWVLGVANCGCTLEMSQLVTTTISSGVTVNAPNIVACDSAQVDATWYFSSQTVTNVYAGAAANGCDSTRITNVTINNSVTANQPPVVACDSAQINSTWYFTSQTVTNVFTGAAANGCDSTSITVLTINNAITTNQSMVACDSAQINSTWYFTSQTVTDLFAGGMAATGCDSTSITALTINNSVTTNQAPVVACDSAQINSTWYFSSQTVTNLFTGGAANGCDSTSITVLTINNSVTTNQTMVACDSAQINSTWYFSSQTVTNLFAGAAANGCDSTSITALTINNSITTNQPMVACDSAQINSTWYFTSQTVTDLFAGGMAATGCDSTSVTVLTINNSVTTNQPPVVACDSAQINSTWYYSSQTVTDLFSGGMAGTGCDSTSVTALTINNSVTTNQPPMVACDSAQINGTWYFASQTVTDLFAGGMAGTGCDSTSVTVLTINNSVTTNQPPMVACDSAQLNGTWYFASQTVTDLFVGGMATTGCDSTSVTVLTINTVNTSVTSATPTLTADAVGATYQWLDCSTMNPIAGATNQSYTATVNGSYAVSVTENGCTDTSVCYVVNNAGIGENSFGNNFIAYPNPVENNLIIDLQIELQSVQVQITDINGKAIQTYHYENTNLINLDVSLFDSGIYLIRLLSNNELFIFRISKVE